VSSTEAAGVLDITSGGAGFLRRHQYSYLPSDGDVYVAQKLIQRYRLRTGDEVVGEAGPSPGRGKNPPLVSVTSIHGLPPEELGQRPDFQRLAALHPKDQLVLECGLERRGQPDHTNRIIDLFCPFGKGQRAMIVAQSKAGKTMVLQAVAEGVVKN
jgi:transcription termination factor Rho